MARIAYSLGMKVQVHDPFMKNPDFSIEFSDGQKINTTAKSLKLNEILKTSDIITLHIGGTKEIIGEKDIALMKPGSFLVNTSRGGVINEEALDLALENKHLAGAALDVFNNEPQPAIKLLMNPNLSMTPHIGAATIEAQERIGLELANHIITLSKQ